MSELNVIPELKQIVGALLFAAREPVSLETLRKVLRDAAKQHEGPVQDFGKAADEDILAAVKQLNEELTRSHTGIHVGEVANGFRLQNDLNCGLWIRQMLEKGRNNRLSKPALETLAIIAYRQPCTRQEIEAVRGVSVDAILKNLMEMQLVKAAGRSELPGRPWLFATTQKFLEYFGLKNVQDLPGIEELRRMEKAQAEARRNESVVKPAEPAETAPPDQPDLPNPSELSDEEEYDEDEFEDDEDDEDEYDDDEDEGDEDEGEDDFSEEEEEKS